jgi:hypothetical protein
MISYIKEENFHLTPEEATQTLPAMKKLLQEQYDKDISAKSAELERLKSEQRKIN